MRYQINDGQTRPLATVFLEGGEAPEHEIEAVHDEQRRVEVREKHLRVRESCTSERARLRVVLQSVGGERHQKAVMEAVSQQAAHRELGRDADGRHQDQQQHARLRPTQCDPCLRAQ